MIYAKMANKTTLKSGKGCSIPIRFSWQTKHALEQLAKEYNLPLSTFIRQEMQKIAQSKTHNLNKSSVLIAKLKSQRVSLDNLEKAESMGKDFRKDFKVRE